jgi:DNA-directed RNA polymerase sigma subunit (sigma70/sigma32)
MAAGKQRDRRRSGGGSSRRRHAGDDRVAQLEKPLAKVLDRLPETQRRVLEHRMGLVDGHPHSLADTADALGLDESEAAQIEARAFDHIREVIPLDRLGKLLGS